MVFFWEVGVIIKEKFDGVMEVKLVMIKNYLWLVLINLQFKLYIKYDLVYFVVFLDFCEFDLKMGLFGIKGCVCNKIFKVIDGCELMCCGRGYEMWK